MSKDVFITIIELAVSVLIEGVLISWIFAMMTGKSQTKMETKLKEEMKVVQDQNKFNYEQIQLAINNAKSDVINQIKEQNPKTP